MDLPFRFGLGYTVSRSAVHLPCILTDDLKQFARVHELVRDRYLLRCHCSTCPRIRSDWSLLLLLRLSLQPYVCLECQH